MILCCGEALIDMIPSPTVAGAQGFVPHCGGAVFNTAIALGRLGVASGMLTGLSSDLFGQKLLAGLHASHVDTSHVVISDRPTTLAFVQLQDGQASYSFYDENSAGRMLQAAHIPAPDDAVKAFFFGGISLACEPAANGYAGLAMQDHGDKPVMLDPNIRPDFITDRDRFTARLDGMLRVADIVKLSDEDLGWIMRGPETTDDKIARLCAMGPSVVILTRGDKGATAWSADATKVHVPARKVTKADTVGAGDTFNAGVLAYLARCDLLHKSRLAKLSPDDLDKALAYGADAAAITVSRIGPNPPWLHEVTNDTA